MMESNKNQHSSTLDIPAQLEQYYTKALYPEVFKQKTRQYAYKQVKHTNIISTHINNSQKQIRNYLFILFYQLSLILQRPVRTTKNAARNRYSYTSCNIRIHHTLMPDTSMPPNPSFYFSMAINYNIQEHSFNAQILCPK